MIRRFVLLGVILTLLWGSVCGQTYILNAALNGQTITTCSGTFYDSGGPNGNYGSNQDYTVTFVSATPAGIMELLKRYKIETSGKHCVVIGRSNIVGKPMATLMMQKA